MQCSWMIWFGGELVVARHAGIGARMATVVDEWCHLVGVVAELASSDDSWCLVPKLCCQFVLCTMGFFFSFFFFLFICCAGVEGVHGDGLWSQCGSKLGNH